MAKAIKLKVGLNNDETPHRGNLAGSVTWSKDGQPLIETPASWLSEDGGNSLFRVKSGALSAFGTEQCFAVVNRYRRDPDALVDSIVAVLMVDGVELRRLWRVGSIYFTMTPGGNDAREVRYSGAFSILGKVLKIIADFPTSHLGNL